MHDDYGSAMNLFVQNMAEKNSRELSRLPFLRYFTVLAEELHFGRASHKLSITQPTLSGAIKSLEEELNIKLFKRDKMSVQLTPAGAAFLVEVRHVLDLVSRARDVAIAVAHGVIGRLDIAFAGTLMFRGISKIITEFKRLEPGIEVALHEMSTSQQIERLHYGSLSAGFIYGVCNLPGMSSIVMKNDNFVLCLPNNHPKANFKSISLADVSDEKFLMFKREVNPANYDSIISIFSRSKIYPRFVHSIGNWFTMVAMVSEGLGLAIVAGSLVKMCCDGVRMIPISDESVDIVASLTWNESDMSPALHKFICCANDVISSME